MTLALTHANGVPMPADYSPRYPTPVLSLQEVWEMAGYVAASGMFKGAETPERAFTLMMLCQSEGIHPMQAIRRFDIIEGKPALKAAAVQAEFQARGGEIEIVRTDAEEARAIFRHPTHQPKGVELSVNIKKFREMGLTSKAVWKNYPDAMLWWRLVVMGVRRVYPGIVVGIYSTEEVEDMHYSASPAAQIEADRSAGERAVIEADAPVVGWDQSAPDRRNYAKVVADAVAAVNAAYPAAASPLKPAEVHKQLIHKAIHLGFARIAPPTSTAPAVKELDRVYGVERAWVRQTVSAVCGDWHDLQAEAVKAAEVHPEDESQDADAVLDEAYPDAEPGSEG